LGLCVGFRITQAAFDVCRARNEWAGANITGSIIIVDNAWCAGWK
jgi:hypothetical protein